MKVIITIFLLYFSFSFAHQDSNQYPWPKAPKQDMQIEFTVPINEIHKTVKFLKSKSFDVTYVDNRIGVIHVLINQDDFSTLKSFYPQLTVKSSRYISLAPDQQYKSYDEIRDVIANVQNQFPELVHVQTIGKSLEGRDIIAVRISNDVDFNTHEPSVLFNALHHAREVMTVEIIEDILKTLTTNYLKDEKVRAWVDGLQIWLIPMVNPDGSNKVWTSDAMWRKNTRNNIGVDINRNYPYKWGECNGSSSSSWAQDYRGPSAGSEPETQTMMGFIEKTKPIYNISYHSYGEMVIHPFGCEGQLPHPNDQVVETAKTLGGLVKHVVGASWQILYDVDGGDIDWMYGVHHVIPFVLEVSTRGDGFQPSYSRRDPVIQQNRPGWSYILAKASGIGLPQISNRTPQQQPRTIRWGGRWFQEEQQKYLNKNKKSLMSNDYLKVRILNSMGRILVEHIFVPSKDTQHYMLKEGVYTLQIVTSRGYVISRKQFTIDKMSDEAILVN